MGKAEAEGGGGGEGELENVQTGREGGRKIERRKERREGGGPKEEEAHSRTELHVVSCVARARAGACTGACFESVHVREF